MTKVKICGLTKAEDAITAAAAGADLLGFIMAESRRRVTIGQARDLVQAVKAHGYTGELVGVFVNEPADTINQVAAYAGFGRVQLSGDETPEAGHAQEPSQQLFPRSGDRRLGYGKT